MPSNLKPRQWLLVLLGLLFAGYCLYQARFLAFGPQVWIDSPRDGAVVASSTVTLSGRARNAAWLTLNGGQIFTDQAGLWSEQLIVPQGLSIMSVTVRDRFGRERETEVRIILN